MDAEYVLVRLPDDGPIRDRVAVIGPLDSDQIDIVMDVHRRLGHPVEALDVEDYERWREWAEEYADLEPGP